MDNSSLQNSFGFVNFQEREETEKDLKALARKNRIEKDASRFLAVKTLAREKLEALRRKKYLHEQAQLADEKIRRKREREKVSKIECEIPPPDLAEESTIELAPTPYIDSSGQMTTEPAGDRTENEGFEEEVESETTDNQETPPPKPPLIKRKTKRPAKGISCPKID